MKSIIKTGPLVASVLCATTAMTPLVSAGAQEAQQRDARATSFTLEEIMVTAQRREQFLMEVPLAVQAFTGLELEKAGVRDLNQVMSLMIPGASEGRGNSAGIIAYQIRGVSSFLGDSTVGYYLDEAAYVIPNRNYAPVARTFDIDRVEVIRGPQGTLFGLGSMGGTVRFITADPDLERITGKAVAGYSLTKGGSDNYYGDAALSVPIVENVLAVRGVASYERKGGYAESPTFPGERNRDIYENYRVKALLKPSEDLTVKLGFHRNITNDRMGRNLLTAKPPVFPTMPFFTEPGESEQVYNMYTAYVGYDFGPVLLESSTGFVDRKDGAAFPILLGPNVFRLNVFAESESFVQEVRAVSQHDGPFEWVIGGIYMDAKNLEDIVVTGGPPISAVSTYDSSSYALFGEASVGLFDNRLRPLVGLRYFRDKRDFFTQNRPPGPVLPPAFEASETFDSFNPRFNISFEASEDMLFYVNVARGFRSGTFNTAAAVAASGGVADFAVEPDDIWSYEVGGKLSLLDRRLSLELAAYRFDWSDIQLNYTVAGGVQVIRNAGKARGKGFEYIVNWRALPELTVQASGNINSTKFRDIIRPEDFAGTPNVAPGNQIASVPKNNHSLALTYSAPLPNSDISLYLNGMYTYIGKQGDPGDPLARFGNNHNLVRMRAGLEWDRFGVFLYGENLLNDGDPILVSGSGETRYYPRVLGMELKADF